MMIKIYRCVTFMALAMFSFHSHADSFRVLDIPFAVNKQSPWIKTITNQTEWEEFCLENFESLVAPTPDQLAECLPEVDFETEQVIAGGMGILSHEIAVTHVDTSSQSELSISVLNVSLGEECDVESLPLTPPFVAVAVPKTDLPISTFIEYVTLNCAVLF
jgi:hypothetical protein